MIKNILLKTSVLFISIFWGIAQLHADELPVYYFTGIADSNFSNMSNWNSARDGSGSEIPLSGTDRNTSMNKIQNVKLVIQSGDTAITTKNTPLCAFLFIENGGTLKLVHTFSLRGDYGASIEIEEGGSLIREGETIAYLNLYNGSIITIAGEATFNYIIQYPSATAYKALEVKTGGELAVDQYITANISITNNGTISVPQYVSVLDLKGQGIINLGSTLSVTDIENSTFLQAGGGTVIYNNGSGPLISSYNNVGIKNVGADRSFAGESTVHGNLALTDNTSQVTLSNNISVAGDLTVADSKVVTDGTISVAGNVAVSNLAEGSVLNLTLNGTVQNIRGVFNNLEIAAGSVATMTGDLTAENLVLVGTLLNPNNYTLTVTNQTGIEAYKLQLQIAIDGANTYPELVYTVESWATLSAAVSTAQALLAEGADPTTVQLEEAKSAITAAIDALVTNLSVLESRVSAAKASYANPTVYTEATYTALQEAIASVETFLEGKTEITPTELTAQLAVINDAVDALVREVYTFYLRGSDMNNFANWNTERDGSGISAVDLVGNTYIAPAGIAISYLNRSYFYRSHLILEASESPITDRLNIPTLYDSKFTIESGRTVNTELLSNDTKDTIRVKAGAILRNLDNAHCLSGVGKIIVDEGGIIENISLEGAFDLEVNGSVVLRETSSRSNSLSRLSGTGIFTAKKAFELSDAAGSTFLQSGGGTLIYKAANTLLPSYNNLTVEEVIVTASFSREAVTDTVPVYGNLLLSNNQRRVTISNPLDISGNFTVDYDVDNEFPVQASISVAGNISLTGLEYSEDTELNVSLSGSEEQELSGAGFTRLTVPAEKSAVLTANVAIEETLTLNGILDRNGFTIRFGERTGDGVLTDGVLAQALQDSIDKAKADYPDGSLYTEASWQALQSALAAGEALLAGATPAEAAALEAAIAAISDAIAGLEIATGIHNPETGNWKVSSDNASLVITGTVEVKVLSLTGQQIYSGQVNGEKAIALPAGVYIVSANGRTVKIVVND